MWSLSDGASSSRGRKPGYPGGGTRWNHGGNTEDPHPRAEHRNGGSGDPARRLDRRPPGRLALTVAACDASAADRLRSRSHSARRCMDVVRSRLRWRRAGTTWLAPCDLVLWLGPCCPLARVGDRAPNSRSWASRRPCSSRHLAARGTGTPRSKRVDPGGDCRREKKCGAVSAVTALPSSHAPCKRAAASR